MKVVCQFLLVAIQIFGLFMALRGDFHDTPARKAAGFEGAIISLVVFSLILFLLYRAGGMSELF